jgi:asparagine synthase (glutamine-hydrolysing)
MCGIFSIVADNTAKLIDVVDPMLKSLGHRGPDASGFAMKDGCILGHTRLSIIDLTSGDQPMMSADDRYTISFNGEIYNFSELRKEMERLGHGFRTSSDTEVVLIAYRVWGPACLDRFRGMFAFTIWDNRERELFAARDLFGEKPLYFAEAPNGAFFVSSEIKAIIASRNIRPKIDENAVDAYLTFGYVPPDRTIYSNVKTLPPGHYLQWRNGKCRIDRYWQPILHTQPITLADAGDHLRELLQQAVKRQLVADVPVGAFLSGGLDSSTIVALMQMQINRPVKTFSVGFGEYINELPYARAVAGKYETEHHEIDLGTPDVSRMLLRMAEVYDEPFADTSNIPTYLISEFARKHVKVVLSGDGGDELFGGYSWTYPMLVKSGTVPESMVCWIMFRSFSKLLRHRWKSLALYSAGCGLAARWPDMWTRQFMQHVYINDAERRRLWGASFGKAEPYYPNNYYRPSNDIEGVNQGFYFDLTSYLPGDILVKVDRAAMAHGLETRAPFLDRDLVEFALSLPVSLKINGWHTKVLLQEACARYWPEELQGRHKQGFGAPVDAWLNMPAVREMTECIFSAGSLLRALLPGINEMYAKKRDYRTWILLTLGLWLKSHGV